MNEDCPIIVTEGVYKDRHGVIEVVVPDAPCCYGVKVEVKAGDRSIPPTVWYRENEVKKKGDKENGSK